MNIEKKFQSINTLLLSWKDLDEQQFIQQSLKIDESAYLQIQELKNKNETNVCQKTLQNGELAYQCYDFSTQSNHFYCPQCFQKEKHTTIQYYVRGGCCDCGQVSTVKREPFCDHHQLDTQIQIIQLDESIKNQYRQFIQISFALFFSKMEQIVDYPIGFQEQVENAVDLVFEYWDMIEFPVKLEKFEQLNEEIQDLYELISFALKTITDILLRKLRQSLLKKQSKSKSLMLNQLLGWLLYQIKLTPILKILKYNNNTFSLLTSTFLKEPIDNDLQQVIQLHHNQFKICKEMQQCICSILEQYIRFIGFMHRSNPSDKQNFLSIFYNLRVDEEFLLYFSRLIIQNFHYLYRSFKKYKFRTEDGDTVVFNQSDFYTLAVRLNLQSANKIIQRTLIFWNYFKQWQNPMESNKLGLRVVFYCWLQIFVNIKITIPSTHIVEFYPQIEGTIIFELLKSIHFDLLTNHITLKLLTITYKLRTC